jgi:HAD superfamily hydrolase (TIGR01459 family)
MELLENAGGTIAGYRATLCDIWGVVHNGIAVFPEAITALTAYRQGGGRVILITNSPRPAPAVIAQLQSIGVPERCYDAVVTSGDAIRAILARHPGSRIFHLGPERDRGLLEGLDLRPVPLADAESVLCSGLFDDETETPDDYAGLLGKMAQRKMIMYCANPDRVVHRGNRLIYCAGALADRYRTMGGRVILAGKPHSAIYRLAFDRLTEIAGGPVDSDDIIAIGDAVPTDLAGAAAAGLDSLFVSGGIHGEAMGGTPETQETESVTRFVEGVLRELPSLRLVGVVSRLRW